MIYKCFLPNDDTKKDSHDGLADGIKDSFLKGLYDRKFQECTVLSCIWDSLSNRLKLDKFNNIIDGINAKS